jgi:hypothetical protein
MRRLISVSGYWGINGTKKNRAYCRRIEFGSSHPDLLLVASVRGGANLAQSGVSEKDNLYRAVDKAGKTVDFSLSGKRDVNAAKAFLRKTIKSQRIPTKITLEAYAASHRAVTELKENGELPKRVRVRTSKYLPKQRHRTRPPADKATTAPDARIEELPNRSDRYRRYRIGREDQERTVQNRPTRREHGDNPEDLASRPGCVVGISPSDTARSTGFGSTLRFAPEPSALHHEYHSRIAGTRTTAGALSIKTPPYGRVT